MRKLPLYLVTSILALPVLVPIAWLVAAAFKSTSEIVNAPGQFIPAAPTIGNFREVFSDGAVISALIRSLVVALPVTIVATVGAAMLAYVAVEHPIWNRGFSNLALFAYAIPPVVVALPIFVMLSLVWDEILGTLWALAFIHTGFLLPFAFWLLLSRGREFPRGLAEGITLDGGGSWEVLRYAWFPFLRIHLANVAVLVFAVSMNDYVFARFLLFGPVETLPLAIQRIYDMPSKDWGLIAAASTVAILLVTVPTAGAVVLAGRYEVAGHRG